MGSTSQNHVSRAVWIYPSSPSSLCKLSLFLTHLSSGAKPAVLLFSALYPGIQLPLFDQCRLNWTSGSDPTLQAAPEASQGGICPRLVAQRGWVWPRVERPEILPASPYGQPRGMQRLGGISLYSQAF